MQEDAEPDAEKQNAWANVPIPDQTGHAMLVQPSQPDLTVAPKRPSKAVDDRERMRIKGEKNTR